MCHYLLPWKLKITPSLDVFRSEIKKSDIRVAAYATPVEFFVAVVVDDVGYANGSLGLTSWRGVSVHKYLD